MVAFSSVLITGASGGLGRALAEGLAAPEVTLHLAGRDAGRLHASAEACRARGAEVHERVLDVTDAAAVAGWIRTTGRLDLVVANAGIAAGLDDWKAGVEPAEQVRAIFDEVEDAWTHLPRRRKRPKHVDRSP